MVRLNYLDGRRQLSLSGEGPCAVPWPEIPVTLNFFSHLGTFFVVGCSSCFLVSLYYAVLFLFILCFSCCVGSSSLHMCVMTLCMLLLVTYFSSYFFSCILFQV